MNNRENKVAIIGAGITGLTTAFYLKKAGIAFTIFESSDHIGGVIDTKQKDGFVYETGPNSGVIATAEMANLFEDLKDKCELEKADHSSAKRLIWRKGKWKALPSGLISAVFTPLFTLKDKIGILGEPWRKKGTNPNETLAAMVKRRMGQSFLDYAIDPFILGIYAGDPNYIVPKYALPKLYDLEQDFGSFIGGAIKKRKIPKTADDKKATREIFSVKGGLINMVNALVDEIGLENIQLNAKNIQFDTVDEKYILKEDKSVFTHLLSTINAGNLQDTYNFLEKSEVLPIDNLTYAKVTEITLGFKKWEGISLDAFGGLVPFKEDRDVLGVLFLSTLFEGRAPKDGALLTLFSGGIRKPKMAELSKEEMFEMLKREMKDMMGLTTFKPDLFEVKSYEKGIAQYGVDSEERLKSIAKIEAKFRNFYLAGSMRNGVGIADRVKQGSDIAKQIIANNA